MLFTQFNHGFTAGHQKLHAFDNHTLFSYTQGYVGARPNVLGGWYVPACGREANPWAWRWDEVMGTRQGPMAHYPYTAGIPQPQVQPTYVVGQAPAAFLRAVARPALNTNRPEIVCPRPTYLLPKWINMTEWEDDEDEATTEEDEERFNPTPEPEDDGNEADWEGEEDSDEEDYDVPRRFLSSFILSPDPGELPIPFFHSSSNPPLPPSSPASLSPDASELPQPCFDSDPLTPSSVPPGLDHEWSSRSDSFESIISPDPGDLPLPDFEVYDRFGIGGLKFPEPHDCHQDRLSGRSPRDHAGLGRRVSGAGRHRRWPDWRRDM